MKQGISEMLFMLVRSAVSGNLLSDKEKADMTFENLQKVMALAKKHDVAHLFLFALDKNGLKLSEEKSPKKELGIALFRHEQQKFMYDELYSTLNNAEIKFMPLKGSVLKLYYPEQWMRTSCDIDILVNENEVLKAAQTIKDTLGYTMMPKGTYDISLFSPQNMHVELHYDLIEDGVANRCNDVLKRVWDTAKKGEDYEFLCEMPDEMFYFYHIAHMAKHFVRGGCGIRPILDLWILDNLKNEDKEKRNALLKEGELLTFAEKVRALSRVWFENEKHTEITLQMEEFILQGGIYGSDKNRIAVQQQKKGGKLKYALTKIFPPYDILKFQYPVLQKHPWLTPVMAVRRWFKLIFCGHVKRSVKELKYNSSIDKSQAQKTKEFLDNIGL